MGGVVPAPPGGETFQPDVRDHRRGQEVAGTSRTTSFAALSFRNPLNDGARSWPERVHSTNSNSATIFGFTKCAALGADPTANGLAFAASGFNSADSLVSVASVKPVPTLPA